jgi:hypothetical protein
MESKSPDFDFPTTPVVDSILIKDNYEIHLAYSLTDITLYSAFGIALFTPPDPAA